VDNTRRRRTRGSSHEFACGSGVPVLTQQLKPGNTNCLDRQPRHGSRILIDIAEAGYVDEGAVKITTRTSDTNEEITTPRSAALHHHAEQRRIGERGTR